MPTSTPTIASLIIGTGISDGPLTCTERTVEDACHYGSKAIILICRRCDRPLSDPRDIYGWRCAEIMGLNNYYTPNDELDNEELLLHNPYLAKHLSNNEDILTLVLNDIANGNAAILVNGKSVLNGR